MGVCDKCEGTGYLLEGQDTGNIEQDCCEAPAPITPVYDREGKRHPPLPLDPRVVELREAAKPALVHWASCCREQRRVLGDTRSVELQEERAVRLRKALAAMEEG